MMVALTVLLGPLTGPQALAQPSDGPLRAELAAVAALAGEPRVVSAGGMTRNETPLLTLENGSPFAQDTHRRVVLVGGLDGDAVSARLVLDLARWF